MKLEDRYLKSILWSDGNTLNSGGCPDRFPRRVEMGIREHQSIGWDRPAAEEHPKTGDKLD